jgi:hypothetical protein
MMRRPLYIGRPLNDDPEPGEFDVLDEYDIAYGFFEVAQELWRLAGRADRAEAIEDVLLSSVRYKARRLDKDHIVALREALEGLEDALKATVIDEHEMLSMEKVSELRGRTKNLDLDESRGELARYAVSEALFYVDHLRRIAAEALAADAQILFD